MALRRGGDTPNDLLSPTQANRLGVGLLDALKVCIVVLAGYPQVRTDMLLLGLSRASARSIMLRSLDGLKRLYGNDNPWIGWVRNMGVGWFSRRQWLQRKAIEEATGLNDISA